MSHFKETPQTPALTLDIGAARRERLDRILDTARELGRRVQPEEHLLRALDAWLDATGKQLERLRRERERLAAATGDPIVMGPAPSSDEAGRPPCQAARDTQCHPGGQGTAIDLRPDRYARPA